jgi:alkylhydroperoxidase family enzyme
LPGLTSFDIDQSLEPAGQLAGLFRDLSAKFWDQPHVPAELLELCRLDLAVLHKAGAEAAVRHPAAAALSPDKIAAVLGEAWRKSPGFSPAERAVLDFTEYYFVDPDAIPDEIASRVVTHLGDSGLVCLVEALGFIDSRIRLALIYSSLEA